MKLQAVIGANYGDEGKGLVTDYLSSPSSLVVRFNGGAQAGHTVVKPSTRHVFHHFGSGTLSGADTFLSKFFIINPLLFYEEHRLLYEKGLTTGVFVDPQCMVTTPIDMMLNQAVESSRKERHGSCGLGINETVRRNNLYEYDNKFGMTVGDTLKLCNSTDFSSRLRERLDLIKDEYLPTRMRELGLDKLLPNASLHMDSVLDQYVAQLVFFLDMVEVTKFKGVKDLEYESIIFEGAQGLLLDQDSLDFPHVTRSKTGLYNVVSLLDDAGLEEWDLETLYVTRTYLTRHGAGPLPTETPGMPYPGIVDQTNIPNQWQGTLRYGLLDVDALGKRIKDDAGNGGSFNVVLTCVDQLGGNSIEVVYGGKRRVMSVGDFVIAMKSYGAKKVLISTGPTSSDVSEVGVCEIG